MASFWRWLIIVCSILCVLIEVIAAFQFAGLIPGNGRIGCGFIPTATSGFTTELSGIRPGSPCAKSALRLGDVADLRENSVATRYFITGIRLFQNDRLALIVHRGNLKIAALLPWEYGKYPWTLWPGVLGVFMSLIAAIAIAWYRGHLPEPRLLASFLLLYGLSAVVDSNISYPSIPLATLGAIVGVAWILAFVALVRFAGEFGKPLTFSRRAVAAISYTLAAIGVAQSLLYIFAIATLRLEFVLRSTWSAYESGNYGLLYAFSAAALLMAVFSSKREEKPRIAWVAMIICFHLCFLVTFQGIVIVAPAFQLGGVYQPLINVELLLVTGALVYAMLRRRILDAEFVINRAAVFGLLSAIVVGLFVVVEWVLSKWFESASHTAGVITNIGVALFVGISIRVVHKRVDHLVDSVLFRKRHENEAALRRFSREVGLITEYETLLDRMLMVLQNHSSAKEVSILLGATGTYEVVRSASSSQNTASENDPALLAMRTWHEPVDLHRYPESRLSGDFAFPMIVRGGLLGLIVCGEKRAGESYAPDESSAISAVAQSAGSAIDALRARGSDGSVAETMTALLNEISLLVNEVRALPGKLRPDLTPTKDL